MRNWHKFTQLFIQEVSQEIGYAQILRNPFGPVTCE